jgi:hypothetical protein
VNIKNTARKVAAGVFTAGATLSMGFLSFAGMFVISPALGLCLSALVLAVAYEGQIYNEGISKALIRIFDENYLRKALAKRQIRKYLKGLREQKKKNYQISPDLTPEKNEELKKLVAGDIENIFLAVYFEQQAIAMALSSDHHLSAADEKKKNAADAQLEKLEFFFLEQLERERNDSIFSYNHKQQIAVSELINGDAKTLLLEMERKKWLIRFSWIFAIGGGVSSGFAAYSAIQAGVATLAVSCAAFSAIPVAILLTLAVFAAVGYTFMFYQTISDMVQEYGDKWQEYCSKRDESNTSYRLRMVGLGVVAALGIFTTIATAGTWWHATRKGALLLSFGEKAANALRNITVPLMAVAELVYNLTNSVDAVDKISRSDFKRAINKVWSDIAAVREKETFLQFINPFRAIEKSIIYAGQSILFLGHIISMGLISDRLDPLPPWLNATLSAANEAPVDFNYLPNDETEHHHSHSSALLDIIFFPVTVLATTFKLLGVLWDAPFSGLRGAWNKSFCPETSAGEEHGHHHGHAHNHHGHSHHEHGHAHHEHGHAHHEHDHVDHGHAHNGHAHSHRQAPDLALAAWQSSNTYLIEALGNVQGQAVRAEDSRASHSHSAHSSDSADSHSSRRRAHSTPSLTPSNDDTIQPADEQRRLLR